MSMQVGELVGVLFRRERCAEMNVETGQNGKGTEMKRKRQCTWSVSKALTKKTKVVQLVVDKWFVGKGFGFGKSPTGEIVFINGSVVQGAEVLTIGTDALV